MNNQSSQSTRVILAILGIALFLGIGAGLFWLATTSGQSVGVLLTFAAGLSMIFLPCTLPLVSVIVPFTLGKSPAKGFTMALLFGLGISITLAIYGVVVSQLGGYFGVDTFTQYMFLFAGAIAILFGWSELRFIRFSPPEFAGASPAWLQKRSDYAKALGMGMLLGNAGIGCPNPAFYVILTYIAGIGSVSVGAGLGFVHGLGRAVPLLAIVILALLGMNATKWVASKKASIDKIMGWSLVAVGAFILAYGLWGMHWWEDSIFHAGWNQFVMNVAPALAEAPDHPVAAGAFDGPIWIGWWTLIGIVLLSVFWNWLKQKKISAASAVISLLLIVLGILSSVGVVEVEHGHGLEPDHVRNGVSNGTGHAHQSGVEENHPHPDGALDHNTSTLINSLRSTGLTVKLAGEVSPSFFSVTGKRIAIQGENIQVFEYANNTTADAAAANISSDGHEIEGRGSITHVDWIAEPHFYKIDKLIVLYVGENKTVIDTLEFLLGPQFAGKTN